MRLFKNVLMVLLFCFSFEALAELETDYDFVPDGGYVDITDLNLNNYREIVVLGRDKNTMQPLLSVKDSFSGDFIKYIPILDSTWTVTELKGLSDLNQDSYREIAVKASNQTLQEERLITIDPVSGLVFSEVSFASVVEGVVSNNNSSPLKWVIEGDVFGYWKMNGVAGSNEKKVNNGLLLLDLVEVNNPVSASGYDNYLNGAYNFNGINQYLELGSVYTPNSDPLVISAYIKTTSTLDGAIVSSSQSGSRYFVDIALHQGKISVELAWRPNNSNYSYGALGDIIVNDGNWHKIDVVFYNDTVAKFEVWVDDVLDVQGEDPNSIYNLNTLSNGWRIGSIKNWLNGSTQRYFHGSIDEIIIARGVRVLK